MTYLKSTIVPNAQDFEEIGISEEVSENAIEISEIKNENFLPPISQRSMKLDLKPMDA